MKIKNVFLILNLICVFKLFPAASSSYSSNPDHLPSGSNLSSCSTLTASPSSSTSSSSSSLSTKSVNPNKIVLTKEQLEYQEKLKQSSDEINLLPKEITNIIVSFTPTSESRKKATLDLKMALNHDDISLPKKERLKLIKSALDNECIIDTASDHSLLTFLNISHVEIESPSTLLDPEENNFETFQRLIEAGANVNARKSAYLFYREWYNVTPLLNAVYEFCKVRIPIIKNQLFNIIELLLQKKANANLTYPIHNKDGFDGKPTPLLIAAEEKEYELVKLLLKYGAEPKIGFSAYNKKTFSDFAKKDEKIKEIYDEYLKKKQRNQTNCMIQ